MWLNNFWIKNFGTTLICFHFSIFAFGEDSLRSL